MSAAEARLSVPHQRSDVEGESDSPPGLSVPTVEETLAYSHSPDEGGIITFDKRLTDEAAVLAFLKVHNTPPEVAIVVTGWPKRAETVFDARTGLQRTVKHATRGLPEWRKIIDLSQLVEPFGYIQVWAAVLDSPVRTSANRSPNMRCSPRAGTTGRCSSRRPAQRTVGPRNPKGRVGRIENKAVR